jgi:hypothetical protein
MSNSLELVQNKLQNWEVSKLSETEKTQYFKAKYSALFGQYGMAGEVIENIVIEESLYDSFIDALNDLDLDTTFKVPNGADMDAEKLKEDFKEFGKHLANLVRTAPTAYFSNADEQVLDRVDPESLFIQIMTTRLRESMAVNNYLMSRGILAKLQQSGLNFNPTESEKRTLCLIAALFDSAGAQDYQQQGLDEEVVLQATAAHELL